MEYAHKTCTLYTNTVDGESEHNKKMGHARKLESFVWSNNEMELLWLALNYNASKARYLLQYEHNHVVCCETLLTGSNWPIGQSYAKYVFTQKSVSMWMAS